MEIFIRKDLKEMGCDDVDWIHLTPDIDQWQAFMKTRINLRAQ
jgi:hypothetical protein